MSADRLNKSYTKEFNSINTAVNDATSEDDELALSRCRMRARAPLEEPTIPLYHRIKTLLLLASIVGRPLSHASHRIASFANERTTLEDVDEATAFLRRAKTQIGVARAYQAKNDDKNPEAEEAILELNGTLEEVRAYLAEDEAGDVEGDAGDDEEVSVEDEEA